MNTASQRLRSLLIAGVAAALPAGAASAAPLLSGSHLTITIANESGTYWQEYADIYDVTSLTNLGNPAAATLDSNGYGNFQTSGGDVSLAFYGDNTLTFTAPQYYQTGHGPFTGIFNITIAGLPDLVFSGGPAVTETNGVASFTLQGAQVAGDQSGTISFAASPAAVPEMATWAMMVAGFGMVGAGMRRRRQTVNFA